MDACDAVIVVVPTSKTVTVLPEIVATFGSLLVKVNSAGLSDVGATRTNGASPSVFVMAGKGPGVIPPPPPQADKMKAASNASAERMRYFFMVYMLIRNDEQVYT
jgi:hypothetical protein